MKQYELLRDLSRTKAGFIVDAGYMKLKGYPLKWLEDKMLFREIKSKTNEINQEHIDFKDMVLAEEQKGNICVFTYEGLVTMKLTDILKQPAEGILYDLNRDSITVLAFIDDKKWVNDYACGLVITELKRQLDEALNKLKG